MSQMTPDDAATRRELHAIIDERVITILETYDTVKIRHGHVDRDNLLAELQRQDDGE
jgi:hypothetical protein